MPRIEMTRTVRFALCCLRVYLIVLLALIVLSFVLTFYGPKKNAESEPPANPPAAEAVAPSPAGG